MTLKRSDEHLIVLRRKAISQAKLRGMTLNQIAVWLEEEGLTNPETNQPWSITTISNDLKEIEAEWKGQMLVDITDHRARVMAEFGEVKNAAWKAGKLDTVLRALKGEIDLLGLNELERMDKEIALARLLEGLPPQIRDAVRAKLAKRVSNTKSKTNLKLLNPPSKRAV